MNSGTGIYFDGVTSTRREVAVALAPSSLRISAQDGSHLAEWPYDQIEGLSAPDNVLRLGRRGSTTLERLEILDPAFGAEIDTRSSVVDRTGLLQRQQRMRVIGWSVAATVVIFLLGWAVGLANAYANISLGQRMVYDLAADLFAKLQQLSLRFHASKSVGDNIRRVTADCGCVSVIIKDALLPVLTSVVTVATYFSILWGIDATLTLLSLAVVPYMLLIFYLYVEPMLKLSYDQQEEEARIYEVVEQTFSAIPAIQAFSREDLNDRRFDRAAANTLAATVSLTKLELRFRVLMGLATAVGTAGILWLGARHALEGTMSIGTILLFLSYLGSLYDPLSSVMYT